MFCPSCGNSKLSQFEANRPVADFYCSACNDQFELKSQSRKFGKKLANGAFSTKMSRLASNTSPNLVLLHYDRGARVVENLRVVPRCFFIPSIIERRKPLKPTARRAGWVGSNILLDRIPEAGQIRVIEDGRVRDRVSVLEDWRRVQFLEGKMGETRGWLIDVLHCLETFRKRDFSLAEVYEFESELSEIYPQNNNVRPKIRQQLQVLRDNGLIEFLGQGSYRFR